jgi:hypothetical protein
VPLLEVQGGDRGRVLRHLEGGAEGPRQSVPVSWGEGFELLQQGGDGGAIQGGIGGECWASVLSQKFACKGVGACPGSNLRLQSS